MAKRNQTLDSLKGFTIILVMLGHCIILNGMQDRIIYGAIKAIQMPLFMMISGYIIGMTGEIDSFMEFMQKLKKRVVSYVIPFFAWIVILHARRLPEEFLHTLFQLDRGLWFLMTLFLLSTIMYLAVLMRNCTPLHELGFLLVWVLSFVGLFVQIRYGNTFLSPHLTIYYMPFYLCGYLLHKMYEILIKKEDKNIVTYIFFDLKVQIILGLFVFILFVLLLFKFDMVVANNKWQLSCQMMASIFGCYLSYLLICIIQSDKIREGLAFVGKYTLEIYVFHYHFATILGIQEMKLTLYSLEGAGYLLLTFLIMCPLTAASIWLCKRFQISDFLLFGKIKVIL